MISIDLVDRALAQWKQHVLTISRLHQSNDDYHAAAMKFVDELYAYDEAHVLFKPTMAKEQYVRDSKAGAISYFVGADPLFPEDTGFALKNWKNIHFSIKKYVINGEMLSWMGETQFEDKTQHITRVHSTFVWIRYHYAEQTKIMLHHSSLIVD